jgi:hypothetical protein
MQNNTLGDKGFVIEAGCIKYAKCGTMSFPFQVVKPETPDTWRIKCTCRRNLNVLVQIVKRNE